MSHLVPCEGCQRHVRSGEGRCPFCGVAVRGDTPAPVLPDRPMSRAALFVFASTVALGSACQSTSDQGPAARPQPDTTAQAPMYGLPPGPPEDPPPPPAADAGPSADDDPQSPPMALYGAPAMPLEATDAGTPGPTSSPSPNPRPRPRRPGTIQVRYGAPPPPSDAEWL